MTRKRWYQVLFPSVRSVHAQLPTVLVKVYFCTGISVHWGQEPLSVFLKHGAGRALCDTYRYLQQFFVTLSFCHTVTLVTFLLWEKKNEEREFPANSERKGRESVWVFPTNTEEANRACPECFPGKHWEEGRRPLLSVFPANTDRKGERASECSQQTLRRRTECVLSVFPANTERKAKTVAECFRGKHWEEGRRPLPSVFRANTESKGRWVFPKTLRKTGEETLKPSATPKPPTVLGHLEFNMKSELSLFRAHAQQKGSSAYCSALVASLKLWECWKEVTKKTNTVGNTSLMFFA